MFMGNSAPSILTIKYWTAKFKHGRKSMFDDERPGRPKDMTTPEMVNKIHRRIIDDRPVIKRDLAEAAGISTVCSTFYINIWERRCSLGQMGGAFAR